MKFTPRPSPPPVAAVPLHTVLTPRGEKIPTVLPVYKHHAFVRYEVDGDVLTQAVVCDVILGDEHPCPHGFSYVKQGVK